MLFYILIIIISKGSSLQIIVYAKKFINCCK